MPHAISVLLVGGLLGDFAGGMAFMVAEIVHGGTRDVGEPVGFRLDAPAAVLLTLVILLIVPRERHLRAVCICFLYAFAFTLVTSLAHQTGNTFSLPAAGLGFCVGLLRIKFQNSASAVPD